MHDMDDLIVQAVRALAKAGAKRIALWAPVQIAAVPESVSHFQGAAVRAFQAALADVGLPFDPALVQQNKHRLSGPEFITETSYQRQGYETALAVFGDTPGDYAVASAPPDAILSTDDMLTVGALPALQRLGITLHGQKPPGGA